MGLPRCLIVLLSPFIATLTNISPRYSQWSYVNNFSQLFFNLLSCLKAHQPAMAEPIVSPPTLAAVAIIHSMENLLSPGPHEQSSSPSRSSPNVCSCRREPVIHVRADGPPVVHYPVGRPSSSSPRSPWRSRSCWSVMLMLMLVSCWWSRPPPPPLGPAIALGGPVPPPGGGGHALVGGAALVPHAGGGVAGPPPPPFGPPPPPAHFGALHFLPLLAVAACAMGILASFQGQCPFVQLDIPFLGRFQLVKSLPTGIFLPIKARKTVHTCIKFLATH